MTPQEQQMLQGLSDRVNQTRLSEKDPEAERFLQETLGRNPDALYIMAQTLLVQQYALDNAKKQLDDAQSQVQDLSQQLEQARQQPQKHTSFLGSLLGTEDRTPPPPPPAPSQPTYGQSQYAPVPNYPPPPPAQYGQPQYGQPQYGQPGYGAPPSQGGGFLRSAATTAAGVAAGALAFEGIESLMHGFEHNAGYGIGNVGNQGRPEEIINNYYYGDSSIGERAEHQDHLSPDLEDRRDDDGRNNFADTTSDDAANGDDSTDYSSDDSTFDDSGSDDSGSDDFSSDDNS